MKDDPNKFSMIDEGFTIEGTLVGKGRLIIKGTVKGSVSGDDVMITQEGAVYAEARARIMTIGGFFDGRVEVEKELIILSTGHCVGQIKCPTLVVEDGGILNAQIECTSPTAAPK